jgi:hypothetical protein
MLITFRTQLDWSRHPGDTWHAHTETRSFCARARKTTSAHGRHNTRVIRMSRVVSFSDEPREAAGGGAHGDVPAPLLDALEFNLPPNSSCEESSHVEDSSPPPEPPAPPLLALLEHLPDLVRSDILERLDPADFAVLAQVGRHPPP